MARSDVESRQGPTTTKWIDRAKKDDDGREFVVRCRLPRDDLFAAKPLLEAKKASFAFAAGVREKRREEKQDEVKAMFTTRRKRTST